MTTHGVKSVVVKRKPGCKESGDAHDWAPEQAAKRYPQGLEKKEWQRALKAHIKQRHPHLLETELQKTFREKGHELIFGAPYTPGMQPIELLWWVI